ncbi:MAG: hypothetical protein L0323_23765 [Planctomycetes bacterium]|nr:hypothetical protein [Planctomycetota bacterium]
MSRREESSIPFESGPWRGIRDPAIREVEIRRALGPSGGGVVVKETPRKSVHRLEGRPPLALTRYRLLPAPLRWLRGSRALRAFRAAGVLLDKVGILAAAPLFAVRNGSEECLGAVWVEGAGTLAEAVRGGRVPRSTVERLPRLLAAAHAGRVRLRDLKAENLVVRSDGLPVLVDLDGVGRLRRPSKAADDLSRLSASFERSGPVSDRQRLRFLARYFAAREALGRPVADRKAFARRVARRTEERRRRWAATGTG